MSIFYRSKMLLLVSCLVMLSGCSAHSPFILKNTTDVALQAEAKQQAHTDKVLFLTTSLAPEVKYEVIGQINAGKIWYGSSEAILNQMANKARALGADAVIEVATWHQPSGFSWAAPHGSGKAIKFTNKEAVKLDSLGGEWR